MLKHIYLIAAVVFINSFVFGAESNKKWSWNTEVGFVQTTGNSKTASANVDSAYKKEWAKTVLTVKGTHISSTQDNQHSAESYAANEKVDYSVSKRLYLYELTGWKKDRFAGIDRRYNGQGGLGYKIINTSLHNFDSELGIDYTMEEYLSGEGNDYASARAYLKYALTLSKTSTFTQEFETLKNLEDSDDIRNTSITALSASINTYLALKISYTVKYDREPTPGFKKTDTIIASTIILKLR